MVSMYCVREMALPWVWLVLAALAVASSSADANSQLAPAPFILGSRFGRSPPRLLAPRNDKFFLSSRYGKRAEGGERAEVPPLPLAPLTALAPPSPTHPELVCDYTGVATLYRCKAHHRYHDDRRLWDEPSGEDE